MLRGRILDATTLEFVRVTNETSTIDIKWSVAEFNDGVRVQRGSLQQSNSVNNVSLPLRINPSQSFLTWSKSTGAGDSQWGSDDPVSGRVINANTLRFSADQGNGVHTIWWQLVEFTTPGDINVQHLVTSMSRSRRSINLSIGRVDRSRSFTLIGHISESGTLQEVGARMLSSEFSNDNNVRIERELNGPAIDEISVQVIELMDGSRVQTGLQQLASGAANAQSAISAVDPARSLAFASSQAVAGQSLGRTRYDQNDNIGVASVVMDLSANVLSLNRNNTADDAWVGWNLVEFSGSGLLPDPIGLWHLDETLWDGTAGEVVDSSGNGNNGVAVGGALTSTVSPRAIEGDPGTCSYGVFDGVNGYVEIADDALLDSGANFTVAAWVRVGQFPGSDLKTIVSKDTNYEFHVRPDGRINWWWQTQGPAATREINSTTALVVGQWHHVVIRHSPGAQSIFIDGLPSGSANFSGTPQVNSLPLSIADDRIAARRFNGDIDEVRIYEQSLTAAQIVDVMNLTHPCSSNSTECVASFPNALQTHSIGAGNIGRITFNSQAQITNPSDIFLFSDTVDFLLGSCGGFLPCLTNNTAVDQLDAGSFPDTSGFTANLNVPNDRTDTIGDVGDFQYNRIRVRDRATLNISPNQSRYFIDRLQLSNDATLNLVAGDYWIRNFSVGSRVAINVINSGTARVFVQDNVTLGSDSLINSPAANTTGDPSRLLFYGYGQIQTLDRTTMSAIVYAKNRGIFGNDSRNFGAATAERLNLNDRGQYTYDAGALNNVDWGDLCTGVGSVVDHFTLSHANSAIFCDSGGVLVTVSARDLQDNVVDDYTGEITLDTQTGRGEWSLAQGSGSFANGASDDGLATYQFATGDLGIAQFLLVYNDGTPTVPLPANVTLRVYQTDDPGIRDDGTSGSIAYTPDGFTLTANRLPNPPSAPLDKQIPTQVAGIDFDMHIAAFGQTEDDPQCGVIESYEGSKDLSLWMTRSNPVAGPIVVTRAGTPLGDGETAATIHRINFAQGQAVLGSLNYKDVGDLRIGASEGTLPIRGESENFVVRPYELRVSSIAETANASNVNPSPQPPTPVSANDALFVAAGDPVTVMVDSLDADGDITPSFGAEGEEVGFDTSLLQPSGGVNPGLVDLGGTITGGSYEGQQRWDEVGSLSVQAKVLDGNYLGIGLTETRSILRDSVAVGRFVPAYFDINANTPALSNGESGWACAFTYQGQPFGFQTDPVITVTAYSRVNSVTLNYGNNLWKLTGNLDGRSYTDEAGLGGDLQVDSSATSVSLAGANNFDGLGTLTISDELLSYEKNAIRPAANDIPFSALLSLGLAAEDLMDNDGVCYRGAGGSGVNCESFDISGITGTQIRFGRLHIESAFGPEVLPLDLPVRIQQWDNLSGQLGFVDNTSDSCTQLSPIPSVSDFSIQLSDYSGNLGAGETVPAWPGFIAGAGALNLSAPGNGNEGSVRVELVAPAGNDWLLYDWFSLGVPANPSAVATFGVFRGEQPMIYRREVFR
ncbi:LamG domain-containing protein [Aestuariirhabdus sp. Z084]|uniref:LamG domain-containing protein n=1 Tax=Aestuariirhabdus haliotis TaxID=2918751 RepID=UPI00201B4243|nr:LamG domain-containing protein [Aestuariirhabdus haliotis]MCL6414986.1 LamG domain-containing protein [Aestuariirhabdus haliotis]MCL6418918.1 LamG domain-containing protein [Aestuariirhabdus haliotis]